jgi:hypothetical protein
MAGYDLHYTNTNVGSVSVAAGSPVTLEWACQNTYNCSYSHTSCGTTIGGTCGFGSTTSFNTTYTFFSSVSANFPTGGNMAGSTVVYPTTTTTYTLSCGASGSPVLLYGPVPSDNLSITVNVVSCGPAIGTAPGNTNGWVLPHGATRQFSAGGYSKCLTNNGSNDLFIPGKFQAELDSFFSHPPSGVTIK